MNPKDVTETPRVGICLAESEKPLAGQLFDTLSALQHKCVALERELSEALKERDQWKAMAEELAMVLGNTGTFYIAGRIESLTRFREMKGGM
jgi:hypothetical protein